MAAAAVDLSLAAFYAKNRNRSKMPFFRAPKKPACRNSLKDASIFRRENQHETASVCSSSVYDVTKGDRRPAALVRRFGDLYSVAR